MALVHCNDFIMVPKLSHLTKSAEINYIHKIRSPSNKQHHIFTNSIMMCLQISLVYSSGKKVMSYFCHK